MLQATIPPSLAPSLILGRRPLWATPARTAFLTSIVLCFFFDPGYPKLHVYTTRSALQLSAMGSGFCRGSRAHVSRLPPSGVGPALKGIRGVRYWRWEVVEGEPV